MAPLRPQRAAATQDAARQRQQQLRCATRGPPALSGAAPELRRRAVVSLGRLIIVIAAYLRLGGPDSGELRRREKELAASDQCSNFACPTRTRARTQTPPVWLANNRQLPFSALNLIDRLGATRRDSARLGATRSHSIAALPVRRRARASVAQVRIKVRRSLNGRDAELRKPTHTHTHTHTKAPLDHVHE